jgi:hypothetical protein
MHRIADCGGRAPAEQMWCLGYERYAPHGGDFGAVALEVMARHRLCGAAGRPHQQPRTGPNRPEDGAKALNPLRAATVVAY